jgi:MFS family permease
VYITGATALALCATNPGSAWMWAVLIILIGFGGIGASLTLAPLASTYYPPELRSTGVGWANGVGRAGSFFGPLAMAWLMQKHLSPTLVLGALMVPMALCAVFVTLLPLALRRR